MKERKDLKKLIYESWYKQSKRDIDVANLCLEKGYYEWACFCYQEATVKIIKSLLKKLDLDSFRHSVFSLLETLNQKVSIPEELFEFAKEIDKHYIISRYPGANMLKPPYENYSIEDARQIQKISKKIIEFIEQEIISK
ncbi:MAG: HEPN domain-containing protein [Candidatus Calescibacterium sp.]|nr:HEPN domain-containing protein [Candidatus Calescibacterium sp.]MDW8132391.1 HEPN domain-containing protein [Candidatus Calescibacterium sp.]